MPFLELFKGDLILTLVKILALVAGVTIHEFAHAWTANKLGDDTPRLQGRVSLNPAAHLDPLGSLMFILVGFGWGKPVLYNPIRLKRRVDELLIALAGPFSNILFAIFLNILAAFTRTYNPAFSDFLSLAALISALLGAFNMLPLPPLDGSSIIAYFWPPYRSLFGGQIGLLIIFFLIFTGILGTLMLPLMDIFSNISHLFGLI